jgi:hypothetical protein
LIVCVIFVGFADSGDAEVIPNRDERFVQVNYESLDGQNIFPGTEYVMFYVRIYNERYDDFSDDNPIRETNVSIGSVVHNVNGDWIDSPISSWDTQAVNNQATIYDGNTYSFSYFVFHVKPNAATQRYNLTVIITYRTSQGTQVMSRGYIHFDIMGRAELHAMTGLFPGDKDREVQMYIDVYDYIESASLYLTAPAEGFSFFGDNKRAYAEREERSRYDWYPHYLVSVDVMKDAGVYIGTYKLTYENDYGTMCTEEGEFEIWVECLPMVEVRSSSKTVTQGTTDQSISIFISNAGNVVLYGVEVAIHDVSTAYIGLTPDHYEGSDMVGKRWVDVGDISMNDEAAVTMDLVLDEFIPMGLHKVLLDFRCFYMDTWDQLPLPASGTWTWGGSGYIPRVSFSSTTLTLDPKLSDVRGLSFGLEVQDNTMEIIVADVLTPTIGECLVDETIAFDLENVGNVDYTGVKVEMEVRTVASPFRNPVAPNAETAETFFIGHAFKADSTEHVEIHVDVPVDTAPGVYNIPVAIEGYEKTSGTKVVTNVVLRISVRGAGPILKVMEVTPEVIEAGEDFTLTIAITNVGDDTARNVLLGAMPVADGAANAARGEGSEVDGDTSPPEPVALPVFIDDIAPGTFQSVNIEMRCNPDMADGHVYSMQFKLDYTDSYGEHPEGVETIHEVSVKAKGSGGSVQSTLYDKGNTTLTVVAFCLIALVAIYAIGQIAGLRRPRPPQEPDPRDNVPRPPRPEEQPQALPVTEPMPQPMPQEMPPDQAAPQALDAGTMYDQNMGYNAPEAREDTQQQP